LSFREVVAVVAVPGEFGLHRTKDRQEAVKRAMAQTELPLRSHAAISWG